ncbi:MAG TPA: BlaI/MecI/CopY family transcriptional regulator [Gemmatales bacterium]|nr:BlaI/MecI/CopY family transcriptional regulator [Gemmatales bacterium]
MARPPARELTDRELQIMHHFWRHGPATAQDIRDRLENDDNLDLAYTTVATLIRILSEKGFLEAKNRERPFIYQAIRPYEDVSTNMLDDLIDKVFLGSRKALLLKLVDEKSLTSKERAALVKIVEGLKP